MMEGKGGGGGMPDMAALAGMMGGIGGGSGVSSGIKLEVLLQHEECNFDESPKLRLCTLP